MTEETRIHLTAEFVDRTHLNVIDGLTGSVADGVGHIQDLVLQVDLVGLENQPNEVIDLSASSILPLLFAKIT